MSQYQLHVAKWNVCQACTYCENRRRVVLARGSLPCDVLFVGEAPGTSEDVLGKPFVGPAGKLLDTIIERAKSKSLGLELKIAMTNLVACIPKEEEGSKYLEPSKEAMEACQPRLEELIGIAKPTVIVCVGKLASKRIQANFGFAHAKAFVEIVHPAAILRADTASQGLAVQQAVVVLSDAFEVAMGHLGSEVPF